MQNTKRKLTKRKLWTGNEPFPVEASIWEWSLNTVNQIHEVCSAQNNLTSRLDTGTVSGPTQKTFRVLSRPWSQLDRSYTRLNPWTLYGPTSTFVTKIRMLIILIINPITLVLIWKVLRLAFGWYHYFWNPSTFGWVISLFWIFSKCLQSLKCLWFGLICWEHSRKPSQV
jgi:hypothetical protein